VRNYSRVSPQFWTGNTGRALRKAGRDAQIVALYLVSCPSATMCGLFYLPLPTLQHEVGISHARALAALAVLAREGFAHYDSAREVVYVPEMARFQVGESLKPSDNKSTAIARQLSAVSAPEFVRAFYVRYREVFDLPDDGPWKVARDSEGTSKGHARDSEVTSESLRSQDQDQDQDQDQEQGASSGSKLREQAQAHAQEKEHEGKPVPPSERGRDTKQPGDWRSADATRLATATPSPRALQNAKTTKTKATRAAKEETSGERTARLRREAKKKLRAEAKTPEPTEAVYDDDVPF
jgi:hypothetical protein